MIVGRCLDCLEFDDQTILDEQVGEEVAEQRAIFILDRYRVLLDRLQSQLP